MGEETKRAKEITEWAKRSKEYWDSEDKQMKNLDWFSIILAVSASLIGIITLAGGSEYGQNLATRKAIILFLSLLIMFALAYVNYQTIGAYSPILYGVGILLLLLVLVPFIGTKVKGARSWIRVFGFGFQPSEFMKLALVITLSKYLVLRETEIGKFKELIIPFLITAIPLMLVMAQPDLGYAILFIPVLFVLLFLAGANVSILLGFATIGFAVMFIPMYLEYQRFILTDSIVQWLKDDYYQLADAVRILKFETWRFVDHPELAAGVSAKVSDLTKWAIKILTKPENLKIFHQAEMAVLKEHHNFLRDFLKNDFSVLLSTGIFLLLSGATFAIYFFNRFQFAKNFSKLTLILALALLSSWTVRKFVHFKPHQVVRVVSFANPDKFPKGAGYQLRHSLITLGSGKWTGKGFGSADMTAGDSPYMPEWYNDFIFSAIGEQFGFV
ncbi:MAG: hypothetical protein D6767_05965, partial [Candidatus Hydrogenedentota bacterium]